MTRCASIVALVLATLTFAQGLKLDQWEFRIDPGKEGLETRTVRVASIAREEAIEAGLREAPNALRWDGASDADVHLDLVRRQGSITLILWQIREQGYPEDQFQKLKRALVNRLRSEFPGEVDSRRGTGRVPRHLDSDSGEADGILGQRSRGSQSR